MRADFFLAWKDLCKRIPVRQGRGCDEGAAGKRQGAARRAWLEDGKAAAHRAGDHFLPRQLA